MPSRRGKELLRTRQVLEGEAWGGVAAGVVLFHPGELVENIYNLNRGARNSFRNVVRYSFVFASSNSYWPK